MKRFFGASLAIALAALTIAPASAADLPEVKVSANNQVPACATPGRLMAYLRSRNPRIDDRYDGLATQYMRLGEELGIRWDVAFFQMILETGALSYTGDVRASQNNFAGLGASGGGRHGERFADIQSGVKAHLQHLLMYAGEHIDNPVAERTRKVQEWGVLTDWQRSIKGPMTFSLVAKQWAPGTRRYVSDIAAISDGFYDNVCNGPDPQPELVQEARKGRTPAPDTEVAELAPAADAPAETVGAIEPAATSADQGAEIAQRSIEQARKDDPPRASLGATMLGSVAATAKAATTPPPATSKAPPAVTLINPSKSDDAAPEASKTASAPPAAKADTAKAAAKTPSQTMATASTAPSKKTETAAAETTKPGTDKGAAIQTASVAGAATQLNVPPAAKGAGKCKVWTASYGGQRAILIKAATNGTVNYTVLDVNESSEKREVDAYIAAYAKGGEKVGAFPNQTQALDKAFRLCPEG